MVTDVVVVFFKSPKLASETVLWAIDFVSINDSYTV